MMMIVLRLLSLPGRDGGESSGTANRWIRGLRARNPCAIGIQPVHTRVDSCGLPATGASTKSYCALTARLQPRDLFLQFLDAGDQLVDAGGDLGLAVARHDVLGAVDVPRLE